MAVGAGVVAVRSRAARQTRSATIQLSRHGEHRSADLLVDAVQQERALLGIRHAGQHDEPGGGERDQARDQPSPQ